MDKIAEFIEPAEQVTQEYLERFMALSHREMQMVMLMKLDRLLIQRRRSSAWLSADGDMGDDDDDDDDDSSAESDSDSDREEENEEENEEEEVVDHNDGGSSQDEYRDAHQDPENVRLELYRFFQHFVRR